MVNSSRFDPNVRRPSFLGSGFGTFATVFPRYRVFYDGLSSITRMTTIWN